MKIKSTMTPQCTRIITHLEFYGTISSLEAIKEYGITRLAARIKDLKRLGYKFYTKIEKSTNRFGDKVHYTVYSLKPFDKEGE